MIAVEAAERPLDAYTLETLQRLPLADATLSLWAYVLQADVFSAGVCAVSWAQL
jgi:hypothetical protein